MKKSIIKYSAQNILKCLNCKYCYANGCYFPLPIPMSTRQCSSYLAPNLVRQTIYIYVVLTCLKSSHKMYKYVGLQI